MDSEQRVSDPESQKPDMRTDFLRKIGPFGAALILIIGIVGIIVSYTADLGIPEPYTSNHDAAYYSQNADTLLELLTELRMYVFPSLEGIAESYVSQDEKRIVIHVTRNRLARVRAVITRDFDESLFEFITSEGTD